MVNFIKKEEISSFFEKLLQSRILLYCVVFLLVLKIFVSVAPINFPKNIFFADITKTALVDMLNKARQSSGLTPLTQNQQLDRAALMKAQDMVQNQYFSHNSPAGITPWHWFLQSGYAYKYAGENLAIGFYDSQEVYQAWLNSPSHRANMLNPNYKEVGTAVLQGFGEKNAIIVVQDFGSQQAVKPVATPKSNNAPAVKPATEQKITPTPDQKMVEAPTDNSGEKVLSKTIEAPDVFKPAGDNTADNPYLRFLNFAIYSYGAFLQDIVYGALLVMMGIMIFMILFNLNFHTNRQLILRSVLLVVLLSASAIINKDTIISIIPHQIII